MPTIEEDLATLESDAFIEVREEAVARLRAALAARSDPQWVRCEDRMPEPGEPVWIFKNGSVMEGHYSWPSGAWNERGTLFSYAGTSWCPRYVEPTPAPPADTAKGEP